jgi:hypothetical protein
MEVQTNEVAVDGYARHERELKTFLSPQIALCKWFYVTLASSNHPVALNKVVSLVVPFVLPSPDSLSPRLIILLES